MDERAENVATPESLNRMAKAIEDMRADFLFTDAEYTGFDPEAEQFFLSALATLENAKCQMKLAAYKQSQALR